MTDSIHGRGTQGHRLWIYSPAYKWIEVPYGAGQDDTVRSFNVWNGKKKCWMTPAWGRSEQRKYSILADIDALNIYAPGRDWGPPHGDATYEGITNPTSANRSVFRPFTWQWDDWIRLMYLKPRNDPSWRIVAIGPSIPKRVPNVALNDDIHPTDMFSFGGGFTATHNDRSAYGWPGAERILQAVAALDLGADAGTSSAGPYVTSFRNETAGLIDFQFIRRRLTESYAEQGLDRVGQYDPIELMGIRRVYVRGKVSVEFWFIFQSRPPTLNTVFTLWVNSNIPTQSFTQPISVDGVDEVMTLRAPASTTPSGSPIRRITSADLATTPSSYYLADTDFTYVHEGPGEDNLAFYVTADNVPANDNFRCHISFDVSRISVHYAMPGKDTPAGTHRWDALGE